MLSFLLMSHLFPLSSDAHPHCVHNREGGGEEERAIQLLTDTCMMIDDDDDKSRLPV